MTDFIIKKLPYDLSSHAGLAFIGKYLKRVNVNALIDPAFPVRSGVANSDILKSYLALLCLSKSDFDAIESFRNNAFFKRARVLPMAASLVSSPLLVRAACGFCSLKLMQAITEQATAVGREIAFIIKWNPRTSPVEKIAAKRVADVATAWVSARPGKRECLWQGNYSPPQSNNGQSAAMHHTPSSLSELSHEQKDSVILLMQGQIEVSKSAVEQLQSQVRDLQARLNKNSRNSSKPPSSDDRFKPAPKSLREAGQRPPGGQKGHPGSTLAQVAEPAHIVIHEVPSHCDICQGPLAPGVVAEVRQVFELPALRHEVTEYRAMQAVCRCGKVHRGRFAQGVDASVQYGPRAQAAMVHLNQNHAVPLASAPRR